MKISGLGVMAVLRDEAATLRPWLRVLEELEVSYCGSIVYSFVENDSLDDTPAILQAWLRQRPGCLISERLGRPSLRQGRSVNRTIALASARNLALERLLQHPVEWVAVVDGGLELSAGHLLRMILQLFRQPTIAMVAASAIQNVPDVAGQHAFSHYDSWALLDRQGRGGITFAANPLWDPIDRGRWQQGLPVAVSSAFGGLAVVRRTAIEATSARWHGAHGCEHWSFCSQLQAFGPVLVDPKVQPFMRHQHPPRWSEGYAHKVRQSLLKVADECAVSVFRQSAS